MREAYLTGGNNHFDATDDTEPTDEALAQARAQDVTYLFESVSLTEDFFVKIVGGRYAADARDEFTMIRHQRPHPDFLKALRRLTLHMCLLTEQLTDQQLYPGVFGLPTDALNARLQLREGIETGQAYVHPLLESFRCTAVAWKSKGVVLSGEKKAKYRCFGKALKVETPTTTIRWGLDEEDLEDGEYPFFEQMHNALGDLQAEVVAFINGKYGEGGEQLDLFGKDPEPRTIGSIANELLDALDNDRYTVSVGTPGGEMREVGKRKKKTGKDAAANDD
jgi:hypothetical protein